MSQASEESKSYSSWNRTPGKPQQAKMSTISSSTDSGVGRTPTWGCEADCGISGEGGLWSNGSGSTEVVEMPKRGSWDESDTQDNCKTGNLSFGFTSQWGAGSVLPTPGSQISSWTSNSVDNTTNDVPTIDNCWNIQSRQPDDDFLPRTTSIWASNSLRQFSDRDCDLNAISSATSVELNTSSMHQCYQSNITSKANQNLIGDITKCEEIGDNNDVQTWAQAAGKGLHSSVSSEDEVGKREIDEQYETIINRVEGWGSHTVDQSTPWIVDESESINIAHCSTETMTQRSRSATESNVWTNEPPNGVGVWETHYEMIGEKTSRWAGSGGSVKSKIGWEVSESVVATQWGERECDSSVWSSSTNVNTDVRNKTAWDNGIISGIKPESSVGTIGTGSRGNPLHAIQRSNNALPSSMGVSSSSGDVKESIGTRQAFYPPQNVNTLTNNRSNPNLKVRPMMNLGFRKDDAQGTLFNNSIEMNRALNHNSLNQTNMIAQRKDWGMVPDSFRTNPADLDTCMMGSGNNNYIQSPLSGGGNVLSMKQQQQQQMIQQHQHQQMQMSMSGNRMASENQLIFEKQIIKEINQLQAKQQELVQRITGLRSIAGSHVIIQEMTRTLGEVRQQLNTQQATLKVIRGQMMPNGGMTNSNMALSRTLPIGQPQTNILSDLSLHMNDMKLQKRNMDLWPQCNLPSPSTISPYMTMDKPSSAMYYNGPAPCNQMNGSMMPPQSFNHTKPPSQSNFLPPSAHLQSGHTWPSRLSMSSLAPTSQVSSNSDYHCPLDDGETILGYQTTSPGDNARNNTTTTALSLSQTPFSSANGVSSAFNSRDISFASANISEFVPGQPWPGISYSQRDDPNVTLGTGQRSLLSVTNDHLEKLANSNVNSQMTSSDVCANSNMLNRLPSGVNGINSCASITYVLIRDLPSHINIEMLRNALTSQSFPGLIQMHPNLAARWVLLHFNCNEETLKAFKNLYGKVGVVELVPDQEVNQRIQYNNCASMGPTVPCSGLMDFHNQTHNQQQSQSHYLH